MNSNKDKASVKPLTFAILTGRYDDVTWESSCRYRENKNMACIYAPAVRISVSVGIDMPVMIIEMNNTRNQIMGVGLIKNRICTDKKHRVHADTNCNRYIYIGKYHLSREQIDEYNPQLVEVLDRVLFKGYTHSKRGIGLTKMPEKVLKLTREIGFDIQEELRRVFQHYFGQASKPINVVQPIPTIH